MREKPEAAEEEGSWQTSARLLTALQSSCASALLMVGAALTPACKHPMAVSQPAALLMPQASTVCLHAGLRTRAFGSFHETHLSHRMRKGGQAVMHCQHYNGHLKTQRGCSCQMIWAPGSSISRSHHQLALCEWQTQRSCSAGMYKPTQDPEGLQLKTLEALGSSVLAWCSGTANHSAASLSADSAACRQALSAARVLGVLMDVEHRAVHPALDQLWGVVWRCAVLEEGDRDGLHMHLPCWNSAISAVLHHTAHPWQSHTLQSMVDLPVARERQCTRASPWWTVKRSCVDS